MEFVAGVWSDQSFSSAKPTRASPSVASEAPESVTRLVGLRRGVGEERRVDDGTSFIEPSLDVNQVFIGSW